LTVFCCLCNKSEGMRYGIGGIPVCADCQLALIIGRRLLNLPMRT
jgi:hypothetical protein